MVAVCGETDYYNRMFGKFVKKYRWLFLVLAGAALLRFSAIGWGFQFDRKLQYISSVHDDERRELRAIGQMNPRKFDFNPDDAQREGPLHPYIISAVLLASDRLGVVKLSLDENFYRQHPAEMKKLFIAGRLVSATFSVLAVFFVFLVGKRFFSNSVGLLSAVLMAVLPLEVVQSTYFRSYTLANFLLLGVLFASLRIAQKDAPTPWTGRIGAMLAGFAFSTRISMAPVLLLLPAAHVLCGMHAGENLKTAAWRATRFFFSSTIWWFIFGVGITNPALIIEPKDVWRGMTAQLGYGGNFFDLLSRIKNIPLFLSSLAKGVTVPVAALMGIGIAFAARSRSAARDMLWLGAAFAIPYGYAVFGASYATIPRFTMPLMPFVALLWAYAAVKIFSSVKPGTFQANMARACMAVGIAGIVLYPALYSFAHARAARQMHPLEQLARYMERDIPPESSIGITWKHAHFKDIDFKKYPNVVELDDSLSGLERHMPTYLILFPHTCCDFYAGAPPQHTYEPQLERYGYEEIRRFRGKDLSILGMTFSNRIDRQLEYEARVYKHL